MADDVLPASLLLIVLSKSGPLTCSQAACVNRRWRSLASDESLWSAHCRQHFGVETRQEPSGSECGNFKVRVCEDFPVNCVARLQETFQAWHREFWQYSEGLVYRTRKCWEELRSFLGTAYPAVADTLKQRASEYEILEAEASLGWPLPAAARLLYRFCDGQQRQRAQSAQHVGLLGGYYFYNHLVNVELLPLKQVVRLTQRLRRRMPAGTKRVVIAVSCNWNKFFFLDCSDGMVYVGTKKTFLVGEVMPCVPNSSNVDKEAILCWLEEYRDRLISGMYPVRRDEETHSISLFPDKEPLCTQAVTCGVQVRCSSVFVPELSSALDNELVFSYCVRMRLLPTAPFDRCQLSRRHWFIYSEGTLVDEVRGEAVVGMYPLLEAGGDAFVYESCSNQIAPAGSMEGDFTFVPGSLTKPEGPEFLARAASFSLQLPHFIF